MVFYKKNLLYEVYYRTPTRFLIFYCIHNNKGRTESLWKQGIARSQRCQRCLSILTWPNRSQLIRPTYVVPSNSSGNCFSKVLAWPHPPSFSTFSFFFSSPEQGKLRAHSLPLRRAATAHPDAVAAGADPQGVAHLPRDTGCDPARPGQHLLHLPWPAVLLRGSSLLLLLRGRRQRGYLRQREQQQSHVVRAREDGGSGGEGAEGAETAEEAGGRSDQGRARGVRGRGGWAEAQDGGAGSVSVGRQEATQGHARGEWRKTASEKGARKITF